MSRIDVFLVENGYAKSRVRAKELIKNGKVTVNDKICSKASYEVKEHDEVDCEADDLMFVSRGGLKLNKAFDVFSIDVKDKVCADIGASTGGFTQCLLNHGARSVYAVDVGHGQLDESLLNDKRVLNYEGMNARCLDNKDFDPKPSFVSIDVSFISLELIISSVSSILSDYGEIVALVKPQFEAGREALNKKGIVKDKKIHEKVLRNVTAAFEKNDLFVCAAAFSAITGGDGNIEYLLHVSKKSDKSDLFDIKCVVNDAFEFFKQ